MIIARDSLIKSIYPNLQNLVVATFKTLNNSGDKIILADSLGRTIDSMYYKSIWGGNGGKSLERFDAFISSIDSTNWKTSVCKFKATPGRINSVTKKDYDLTIESFTCNVKYVEIGKGVKLNAVIENLGKSSAQNFNVRLYLDRNKNLLTEQNELIDEIRQFHLPAGNTNLVEFVVSELELGKNEFIVVIDFEEDQYNDNNSASLCLDAVKLNEVREDIVINEIMFAPTSPEPEWIEIFNKSSKEIELKGYHVSDGTARFKVVSTSFVIEPTKYLVIARDSLIKSIYPNLQNLVVATFKTLNNSGDKIILADSLGRTIDSIYYKSIWGGNGGKSLERFDAFTSSIDSTNWKTSLTQKGGSPGRINTVSKKNFDGSIAKIIFNPLRPLVGQEVNIKAEVINAGKNDISINLILYEVDGDSIKQKVEESSSVDIAAGISTIYEFKYKVNSITSKRTFEVSLELRDDEDTTNNKLTSALRPGYSPRDVLLNEIMFNPVNGEPEWIELYNNADYDIELNEWTISDVLTNPAAAKIKGVVFPKKSFLVITKDSSITNFHAEIPSIILVNGFANLNNDEDGVLLKDSWGVAIDSVRYSKAWGGESGKSLERKSFTGLSNDKSNWASSIDIELSTPGRTNSISQKDYDLSIKDFFVIEPYVEVEKSARFKVIVENLGKTSARNFDVELLRVVSIDETGFPIGETIETLQQTELSSGDIREIEFVTNAFEEGANKFFILIHFKEDEFQNNNSSAFLNINAVRINELRGDLVINEIMYAPLSPEPEWIEIYNKSYKKIDLKGYHITDNASKEEVVSNSIIIKPGEYFVFARDSIMFSLYEITTNAVITNFPSLNNSGDKVVLTDSLGRVIDSLDYKYTWGGSNGKSIEKFDAFSSSTDSSSWRTTLSEKGGSPGRINTVSKKNYDCAVTKIIFTPFRPVVGEEVTLKAEVVNIGRNSASVSMILYTVNTDNTKHEIERSPVINIAPDASVMHDFKYRINSITSKSTFEINLLFPEDEDITNNTLSSSSLPGYPTNIILVNEIMFNPVTGEPEWIEFYNSSEYDIDVENWTIADILTTPVKTKLKGIVFHKNSFLVISKDSSVLNYHANIPSPILVNGFANLNNDEDGVVLKDSWGVTIDSIRYHKSWGGENGKSLERKSLTILSNDKLNWTSSRDFELSTPGRINSVVQKEFDLAVTQISYFPEFPILGNEVTLCAKIKNVGLKNVQNFSVDFSFINEPDTTLFNTVNVAGLNVLDSVVVCATSRLKLNETKIVLCRVILDSDQELTNNLLSKIIETGCRHGDVLISEIMYNPLEGESEWVEIVNNSGIEINLKNWLASDLVSPTKGIIVDKDIQLLPGEFAVLTPDTNKYPFYPPQKFFQVKFGSLGNTSDGFIIYDNRGLVIDSVAYNSKWGGVKGFSLERLSFSSQSNDSTNWSTSLSINRATPGLKNSITETHRYSRNTLVVNEIMFDPVSGNSEFLEFYNTTNDSIQIGGMTLQIGNDKIIKLSSAFFKAAPQSFIVFAADSSIFNNYQSFIEGSSAVLVNGSFSLSNEGTTLIIRDMTGNCLDSLIYFPSWHNKNILTTKNKSLERLNPAINSNDRMNWSSSVNPVGATPGKQNSVYVQNISSRAKVTINPNPFSPDNDGFEDFTTINFNLTKHLAQVRIKVFDSIGRLVRTLAHNTPSTSNNTIIFNGHDDGGRALRIGIYILLIEAVADDGSMETIKTPIIIARKL